METSPLVMQHALAPEDQARAEFYALLGRLYTAPPDAPLLALVGASELWSDADGNPLAGAWNRLILASRAMDADAAEQEYTELFVGVGKSEVDLHASHWLPGHVMEKPLADLRTELAELGLARQPGVTTYEDNLGALCETMRILVAGRDERRPGAGRDATSVLRTPDRALGVRLLRCNMQEFSCQLLPARSRIHKCVPGDRT